MGFFMSGNEEKIDKRHGHGGQRIAEERYVAARVLYETIPGMTVERLAQETGISEKALKTRNQKDGGWKHTPLFPRTPMSEAAQQVADRYTGKVADYGDEISAEHKHAAQVETAVEVAVDMRAQLLDRHRREWQPFRTRVYKQVDPRSGMSEKDRFEMSKTTKINAETLAIIQMNERKAWGLDKPGESDTTQGVTVVIERG